MHPAGAFSLVADNCTGQSLAAGASCTVDVQFVPLVVGAANGVLTFDLADGTSVSAALVGDGSAEPTLDVVPGVATPGQVVTVFGAGFPAGAIVEFSRSGVAGVDQLTVDPDGTFAHVFVVLPNTPSGPMTLTVAAQPDLFGDVTGELLVSSRSAASTAVFRDGIGAVARTLTLRRPIGSVGLVDEPEDRCTDRAVGHARARRSAVDLERDLRRLPEHVRSDEVEVVVAEVGELGLQQHLAVTQQRHRAHRAGRVLEDHIGDRQLFARTDRLRIGLRVAAGRGDAQPQVGRHTEGQFLGLGGGAPRVQRSGRSAQPDRPRSHRPQRSARCPRPRVAAG